MLYCVAILGEVSSRLSANFAAEQQYIEKGESMILTEEELARIPTAPRAKGNRAYTKPVTFLVAKDPAVAAIARMVVAGVDKKHDLHPHYEALVKGYGKEKAHELIEGAVAIPGACDVIQTDMCYGGIGLFGGLSKNSSRFTFYEWSGAEAGQLSVSMTRQEARDIVSGKKKTVVFKPQRYRIRLCVDPFTHREEEGFREYLKRSKRSIANERVYTKDGGAWSLPGEDYEAADKGESRYSNKFRVVIDGKSYQFAVSDVNHPSLPAHDKRIHIVLEVPSEMRSKIRKALASNHGWRLRSRHALLV